MNEDRQRRTDEQYRLLDLRKKQLADVFAEFGEPAQPKPKPPPYKTSNEARAELERLWAENDRVDEEEMREWRFYPKPGDHYYIGPAKPAG